MKAAIFHAPHEELTIEQIEVAEPTAISRPSMTAVRSFPVHCSASDISTVA